MLSRILILLTVALSLAGQRQKAVPQFSRPPDFANVSYGPHERNVVDLWQAKSARPTPLVIFIHGGGFRAGDKSGLNPALLDNLLGAGISVAAINYRLTQTAPYPAPMQDGARAVQFFRYKAKEWNLDPAAFGATGGSAGAAMSLWIGFRDDMAEPDSPDPVRRQSTRLKAMAVAGGQSTMDPREIRRLIGDAAARHPALEPFYGLSGEDLKTEKAYSLFRDASPITYLTKDDPPVMLLYGEPDVPLPADAQPGQGIHHPRFGIFLKEHMDKLGIECVLRYPGDSKGEISAALTFEFLRSHLSGK